MGSTNAQVSIARVTDLLAEWDKGSRAVRRQMLIDFVATNAGKTGPELEAQFAQAASLFLARLLAWLRLTYMIGTCLNEQLKALQVFLSASSGHKFLAEFLEVGGVLTVLEILGVRQVKEADKAEALRLLTCVATAGRKYKELICESYGIRAIAECLARSRQEETQEQARSLLQMLAEGNSRFELQVYKGLIALLPCSSPKAQQMAAQTLRIVQPIVKVANPSIVEPLLNLLKSLHLEIQYEAIELIKDLVEYEVRGALLKGLVKLLRPTKEESIGIPEIDLGEMPKISAPLPTFVQQAAAAKCIGALATQTPQLAEELVKLNVVSVLMFAMGNQEYPDSQRQAAMTLEIFCRNFSMVDESVRQAMGDGLYKLFMANPDALYTRMTGVHAEVLTNNKLTVPGVPED